MAPAFYPPSFTRTGNPQTMVYANLQPPVGTARRSPAGWWSLTPPSHPYLTTRFRDGRAVILFCRHLLSPIASIFRSGAPCAARTFLPHLFGASDKPEQCFQRAKIHKKVQTAKSQRHFYIVVRCQAKERILIN